MSELRNSTLHTLSAVVLWWCGGGGPQHQQQRSVELGSAASTGVRMWATAAAAATPWAVSTPPPSSPTRTSSSLPRTLPSLKFKWRYDNAETRDTLWWDHLWQDWAQWKTNHWQLVSTCAFSRTLIWVHAPNGGLSNPTLQSRYQNFLKLHPDGRISRKSFHSMMKECYPGADTEKLERHIFRMYDTNKVNNSNIVQHIF